MFNKIDQFIEKHGMLLLDGGLATELEERGLDISTHLWSAQLLHTNPEAIRQVHLAYLEFFFACPHNFMADFTRLDRSFRLRQLSGISGQLALILKK